jgi:cytoskeletal protein CcmA (bactofilin family)
VELLLAANYAGAETAPINGLLVEGDVKIDGKLTLQEEIAIEGALSTSQIIVNNSGTGTGIIVNQTGTNPSSNLVDFRYLNNTVFKIIRGGNVGINTATPVNNLDVAGNMVIGANYAGTDGSGAAPPNGLLTQGDINVNNFFRVDSSFGTVIASDSFRVGDISGSSFVFFADACGNIKNKANLEVSGNGAIKGTLTVTGASNLNGNVIVNTNKFTIAALTGNTTILGNFRCFWNCYF